MTSTGDSRLPATQTEVARHAGRALNRNSAVASRLVFGRCAVRTFRARLLDDSLRISMPAAQITEAGIVVISAENINRLSVVRNR
jgi:hypothetical protein